MDEIFRALVVGKFRIMVFLHYWPAASENGSKENFILYG